MTGKGKIKTRPFDSPEFLDTPEAIAAYLTDALDSGSSVEFQDSLNVVARVRGMTEIAKAAGVGLEEFYKALRTERIHASIPYSAYSQHLACDSRSKRQRSALITSRIVRLLLASPAARSNSVRNPLRDFLLDPTNRRGPIFTR